MVRAGIRQSGARARVPTDVYSMTRTVAYDEDRLYCPRCEEQPDHFLEEMSEHVSPVAPDGGLFEPQEERLYVAGYRCPTCGHEAEWGHVLNDQTDGTQAP